MCSVRSARPGITPKANRAMGFCLFNNIAIAAHYARAKHGAERVAVVDFDVHHGNGTQEIFWSDKDLFYGSTHQMPLFPGTGALNETGVGNIFNAPLREGDGRDKFEQAFRERILGPLHNFAPDIVFDLGGLRRPSQRSARRPATGRGRFRVGDGTTGRNGTPPRQWPRRVDAGRRLQLDGARQISSGARQNPDGDGR